MRKGQFTLFAVLGVVLIIFIVLFLVLLKTDAIKSFTEEVNAVDDVTEISDEVSLCLQSLLETKVNEIGVRGGSLEPSEYIIIEGNVINTGEVSVESMETELEEALENEIRRCDTYGAQFVGDVDITVSINDNVEASSENLIMYNNRSTTLHDVSVSADIPEMLNYMNSVKLNEPITYMPKNSTAQITKYDEYYVYTIEKNNYWFVFVV
jgi:hypothetical protein